MGGMPGYTASKAAIEALTRSFARDLGPYSIRVNMRAAGVGDDRDASSSSGSMRMPTAPSRSGSACPTASSRTISPAWCSSLPPTKAACAPRRISSSTAAGCDAKRMRQSIGAITLLVRESRRGDRLLHRSSWLRSDRGCALVPRQTLGARDAQGGRRDGAVACEGRNRGSGGADRQSGRRTRAPPCWRSRSFADGRRMR